MAIASNTPSIILRLAGIYKPVCSPYTAIFYVTVGRPFPTVSLRISFTDPNQPQLTGSAGSWLVIPEDEITLKLAMLYEGQCEGLGPTKAATKFGYTKGRSFQWLPLYEQHGAMALQSKPTGPQSNYRRTDEVVRQVIRHRFLDPEASCEVIAQKLQQTHHPLSLRSIHRVVADYGLPKKTLRP